LLLPLCTTTTTHILLSIKTPWKSRQICITNHNFL
jgi:hypothetical protein